VILAKATCMFGIGEFAESRWVTLILRNSPWYQTCFNKIRVPPWFCH